LWRRWRRGVLPEAAVWGCDAAADVGKSRVTEDEVLDVMPGTSDVVHGIHTAKRDVDGLRLRERLQVPKSQQFVAEELDSLDLDLQSWKASSSQDLVAAKESRCQPQEVPSGRSKELFEAKR